MAEFDFTVCRGDTIRLQVPVVRNGSAVDITGATMYFTGKRLKTDDDSDAVIQKSTETGITLLDAVNGLALITIAPEDTDSLLDEPRLYCDIELIESNGLRTTIATGRMTIRYDISRI